MAIPKVSKMVTDRQRRFEVLTDLVKTYGEEFAEATAPGIPAYLDLLKERLTRVFDDLVEAEKRHLDELANDSALRRRRGPASRPLPPVK